MTLVDTSFHKNFCHSWPSKFSVILFLLFAKGITTTAQNYSGLRAPINISTHQINLKVGSSSDPFILPTNYFKPVFEKINVSVVLVFHPSMQGVVQELQNVTLIEPQPGNGTGPISFTNSSLHVVALKAGQITVTSKLIPDVDVYKPANIFLRIEVYKFETLVLISNIVGWIYFFAWSISFYPQIIQNYQRKSVRGLSLDFVVLNITGFSVYSVYNVGLFWFKSLQDEYHAEYPQGVIPVQLNDVVFSLHALFACAVTAIQCLIYDRGSQNISNTGKMLLCTFLVFIFVIFIVAASQAITWLTFLTWCSYVKLVITLIKYVPQAYLNWYRKSTSGWSIGNVLLDFTGGVFSLAQMIIIAYNFNDWSSFFGDITKFGLGLFSILFDIFFIVQHYVLYRNHVAYEPIEGGDNPVDPNQYDDITTSNHHFNSSLDAENNSGNYSGGGKSEHKYEHHHDDIKENPSSSSSVKIGNSVPVVDDSSVQTAETEEVNEKV